MGNLIIKDNKTSFGLVGNKNGVLRMCTSPLGRGHTVPGGPTPAGAAAPN